MPGSRRYGRGWAAPTQSRSGDFAEGLGEAVGVRAFRLGQRLEPVGDLVEAFLARGLGHARVHVGVLVRLAGDRGLQVADGVVERHAGGGGADGFAVFEETVRVAGFALDRKS